MTIDHQVDIVVGKKFKRDPDTLRRETHLFDDLKADSLDQIELVMELEDAFGIEIPEAHINSLITLGDVIDCVKSRTGRS